jgi:hypothetical protein
LLYHRPPRYQAETHAIVQHREAATHELERTAVKTGHAPPIGNGAMCEAGFRSDGFGCTIYLASTQRPQQIARQDHALSASLGQPLFNEEIRPLPQRFAHRTTEAVAGDTAGTTDQLLIQPGRADHADLPLNG